MFTMLAAVFVTLALSAVVQCLPSCPAGVEPEGPRKVDTRRLFGGHFGDRDYFTISDILVGPFEPTINRFKRHRFAAKRWSTIWRETMFFCGSGGRVMGELMTSKDGPSGVGHQITRFTLTDLDSELQLVPYFETYRGKKGPLGLRTVYSPYLGELEEASPQPKCAWTVKSPRCSSADGPLAKKFTCFKAKSGNNKPIVIRLSIPLGAEEKGVYNSRTIFRERLYKFNQLCKKGGLGDLLREKRKDEEPHDF